MKTYLYILVAVLFFVAGNANADVVALWHLDEGIGTTAYDSVGSHHANIDGASWIQQGASGKALYCNGYDVISVPDSPGPNPQNEIALEVWVKPAQNCTNNQWNYAVLVHKALGDRYTSYQGYVLGMTNSRFDAVLGLDGEYIELNANFEFPTDRYTRIGLTYDGSEMALWAGNDKVASRAASGSISPASVSLRMGGLDYPYYQPNFTGEVDEFMIGNKASDYIIPEPCTLALLGSGMILVMVAKRKERKPKMKTHICILILALFFMVPSWAYADLSEFPNFPICTNNAGQIWPAIDRNMVIWQDYRNGNYDVYGYNLSTRQEFPICTQAALQSSPDISGNTVVWHDLRSGSSRDIFSYNLSTGIESPICTNGADQYYPAISGNTVVWTDYRNGNILVHNWDIYGFNLSTRVEFPICTNTWEQDYPTIAGNVVVWQDWRNSNWDIYGYNLSTSTEFNVCMNLHDQVKPAIMGDVVVWEDYRNGNWDIYGYDLIAGEEFPICTSGANQHHPNVNGNIVVWVDESLLYLGGSLGDIFGYDLIEGKEFFICATGWEQNYPDISGDTVVWQDYRNGNFDIYYAIIPEPATLSLLVLGSSVLLLRGRRRKR